MEFYVDGQRIDAQFPTQRKFIDYPTIGPVNSTIKSQYGRGINDNGEKVAWRREVFFALIGPGGFAEACTTKLASGSPLSKYGTIDCKVFRSEISPEWAGGVTPDEFCSPSMIKVRHVSHVARLGAKLEAHSVKRFCVRSLDPDDAPFVWFKFFYRSRGCLMKKFKLPEVSLLRPNEVESVSRDLERKPITTPQSRLQIKDEVRKNTSAIYIAKSEQGMESFEGIIQHLEKELAAAESEGSEQKEKIISCHKKIGKLRDNSVKLRGSSIQLQRNSEGVYCGGRSSKRT